MLDSSESMSGKKKKDLREGEKEREIQVCRIGRSPCSSSVQQRILHNDFDYTLRQLLVLKERTLICLHYVLASTNENGLSRCKCRRTLDQIA